MEDEKFSLSKSADKIAQNPKQTRNQPVEKSAEGNGTWKKFDAENENGLASFDLEEGEADHDEIPNDIMAHEIFDDIRGPGFQVAAAEAIEQQAEHIQNIEKHSCSSFWKVFAILFLVCATVLVAILLTKQNIPDTKMENEVQKPFTDTKKIQREKLNVQSTLPNNDVDQILEDATGTRTGGEKTEAEAKKTDYSLKENIPVKSRKLSRYFKALRSLAQLLFKPKYFLLGIALVVTSLVLQPAMKALMKNKPSFERISLRQTIQTALNSETQNEIGKPAVQSLSPIPKMFLGKTCPRPSADFIETFESKTMKKTIQTAFNSFRTSAPAPSKNHSPKYSLISEILLLFGSMASGLYSMNKVFTRNARHGHFRFDIFVAKLFLFACGLYTLKIGFDSFWKIFGVFSGEITNR